jgi:SAM-dependent methyltransferase
MLINLIFLIFILLTALYASLSAAPWLPTRKREAERMMELASLRAGDVVYDLGCGDGRLLWAAKKKEPGIKVVGVEISLLLYLIAKIRFFFCHSGPDPESRKNISVDSRFRGNDTIILFKNLFKVNLTNADVVFIYLLPKCYEQLKTKLERELRPGSRVVVGVWPIESWENKLIKKDKPTEKDLSLFLYQM